MDLKGPFIVKIGSRESPFAIFKFFYEILHLSLRKMIE
jgi:hypothetical protein